MSRGIFNRMQTKLFVFIVFVYLFSRKMALCRFTLRSSPQMTVKVQESSFRLKLVSTAVFTNVLVMVYMGCHLQCVNQSSVNRRINYIVWNLKISAFTTAIRPRV